MKILFNVIGSNLGNNGGSETCVKSANELHSLGHKITIIADGKNKYTWDDLKCEHLIINNENKIPNADAIVSISFRSMDSTERCKIKNKFVWIRGYEKWSIPEEKIIKILKETKCKKLVNSICLQNKLNSFNLKSKIIRPGYDFDKIYPIDIRKNNKEIVIGGLFNSGNKRKTKRTEWVFETYNCLRDKYNIKLIMFGSDGKPKIDNYYKNPNIELKNKIYNTIDIWLSPSELEGLHIPPAEALLTRCSVITTNAEMSGTQDYIFHKKTGIVSNNNLKDFIKCTEKLILNEEFRIKLGTKGRDIILSLGDRKENMNK